MDYVLTTRHYNALEKLRAECDYEDSRNDSRKNYVCRNKLSPDIGKKTLSDLEGWRLIVAGTVEWSGKLGYRITDLGRRELKLRPPKGRVPKVSRELRNASPRLGTLTGRLER